MARLRAPDGCPWDREQDHRSLRWHAVEEVYELMDAIEAGDDHEMAEELGDLLLQVVFHCQLAQERGAFDFEMTTRKIVEKLIRRHPHVFGDSKVKTVEAVWTQWDQIKKSREARHTARAILRVGWDSPTTAGAAARGKAGQESAQGRAGWGYHSQDEPGQPSGDKLSPPRRRGFQRQGRPCQPGGCGAGII